MIKFQVTLTKVVRVDGERRKVGDVIEVDECTFAELKYHNAFNNVVELQSDDAVATLLKALPDYKNIKGDDIKEQLTLRGIPFDTNDKSELYELLKTVMENKTEAGE